MNLRTNGSPHDVVRAEIGRRQAAVEDTLRRQVESESRLTMIKAPPGSGKTHTLLVTAAHAFTKNFRVAIAAQTRSQADDICRRIGRDHPTLAAFRFGARADKPEPLGSNITWVTSPGDIPRARCVVVATTAKWG